MLAVFPWLSICWIRGIPDVGCMAGSHGCRSDCDTLGIWGSPLVGGWGAVCPGPRVTYVCTHIRVAHVMDVALAGVGCLMWYAWARGLLVMCRPGGAVHTYQGKSQL